MRGTDPWIQVHTKFSRSTTLLPTYCFIPAFYCLLSQKVYLYLPVLFLHLSPSSLPFKYTFRHLFLPFHLYLFLSFYLYLSRNVSHLSMTRAVSAIGSILLIILAISSWHFAAKTVAQLKNLEEKNREQKNSTYCANVHLLMHANCPRVQLQCKLSEIAHTLCKKKNG
jgi:hypothetical protein